MKSAPITAPVLAAIIAMLSTVSGLNIAQSFNDVAQAAIVVTAVVALIRKAVPAIDSHYVIALSIASGAIMYGAGSMLNPITVAPFAAWQPGLSGMAFGAYAGALASGIIGTLKSFMPGAPAGLSAVDLEPIGGPNAQNLADPSLDRLRNL